MRALRALRTIALAIGAVTLLGVGIASASGTSANTGIISGTVIDTFTKTSLWQICVKATNESDPTIFRTAQSTGNYVIGDLPPGVYDVSGASCGTVPLYGGPDVIRGVVVAANTNTPVTLLNLTRVASPFPYGSIAGAVVDATTGAPVSGVCVTGPVDGRVAFPTAARQTTVSDADGRYRFDNIVPLSNAEAEFRDCPNAPQIHNATSVHMVVSRGPIVTNMPAAQFALNSGTPPTKPATPTNVQASRPRRSTTVTVTWTEAVVGGGDTPTSFVITAYPVGRKTAFTSVTVDGTVRTANVTGLHVGNRYVFTVIAVNSAGSSTPSALSNRA